MGFKYISFEKKGALATVTIDRPDVRNAIDVNTVAELLAVIQDVSQDDAIRVLIIAATGKIFSSGGDVKAMVEGYTTLGGYDATNVYSKLALSMANMDKVTIAKVNGAAVGAGLSLALSADIIVASDKARFSAPFFGVGLIPDTGLHCLLTRAVGLAKAKEIVFTQEMIDASEAERIGLVNKVVPADQLDSAVEELANKFAALPPIALSYSKQIFNKTSETESLSRLVGLETYSQAILTQTEDHKEGVQAFLGKRTPKFTGK